MELYTTGKASRKSTEEHKPSRIEHKSMKREEELLNILYTETKRQRSRSQKEDVSTNHSTSMGKQQTVTFLEIHRGLQNTMEITAEQISVYKSLSAGTQVTSRRAQHL